MRGGFVEALRTGVSQADMDAAIAAALAAYQPTTIIYNAIPDSGFEAGVDDWLGVRGTETVTHETAVPIFGDGSLKLVVGSGAGPSGVVYAPDETGIELVEGSLVLCSVFAKGTGDIFVKLGYDNVDADMIATGTLSGTAKRFSGVSSVPHGSGLCYFEISLDDPDENDAMTIDDVVLAIVPIAVS